VSYPVPPIYPWTTDEVIRAMAKFPSDWLKPEEIRRAHGLPPGCSQSHRLRAKLVELIDEGLVAGSDPCPTHPQRGFTYILTEKGIAYARRKGWL
jgi:hypothetical protein